VRLISFRSGSGDGDVVTVEIERIGRLVNVCRTKRVAVPA
jgi:hypothetical protein